jgi:hypothetical protein
MQRYSLMDFPKNKMFITAQSPTAPKKSLIHFLQPGG